MPIRHLPNDDKARLGRSGSAGLDAPISLREACERVFNGAISVATLKAEARRGNLFISKIGPRILFNRTGHTGHGHEMPRVSSGAHLRLDKARDKWTIIDGKRHKRTGFTKGDARKAQQALADYIGAKHVVSNGPEPPLAGVLAVSTRAYPHY